MTARKAEEVHTGQEWERRMERIGSDETIMSEFGSSAEEEEEEGGGNGLEVDCAAEVGCSKGPDAKRNAEVPERSDLRSKINFGAQRGSEGARAEAKGAGTTHGMLPTESTMLNLLNQGVRTFNLNPMRGVEFIRKNGLVQFLRGDEEGNARRVAIFLRHTRGLNKEQIGKLLGSELKEHTDILRNYFQLFDFSSFGATVEGVESALRSVFDCFKPPGEAQKILRILGSFAEKFNEDNSIKDARVDGAELAGCATEILAYSIILLNVDLHNPNNPQKMSKRAFVRNNRGINDGKDFPELELMKLYDRILRFPIRHKVDRDEVAGNLFTQPDKCGWLSKKGVSRLSQWKRRWFILSVNALYYFRDSEDVEILGFIPLENVSVRTCFDVENERSTMASHVSSSSVSSLDCDPSSSSLPSHQMQKLSSSGQSSKLKSKSSKLLHRLPHTKSDFVLRNSSNPSPDANRRRTTRRKHFWFEIYPVDSRSNVKSARMSKNGLLLGQHRTVKIRASSRQEMEQWVELINQKCTFNTFYERARLARQDSEATSVADSVSLSTRSSQSSRNPARLSSRLFRMVFSQKNLTSNGSFSGSIMGSPTTLKTDGIEDDEERIGLESTLSCSSLTLGDSTEFLDGTVPCQPRKEVTFAVRSFEGKIPHVIEEEVAEQEVMDGRSNPQAGSSRDEFSN